MIIDQWNDAKWTEVRPHPLAPPHLLLSDPPARGTRGSLRAWNAPSSLAWSPCPPASVTLPCSTWLLPSPLQQSGPLILSLPQAWQSLLPLPTPQVSYTFSDYPPGVRHILFQHGGKDTQFWAGWYGPRVTNSSIIISPKMTGSRPPAQLSPRPQRGRRRLSACPPSLPPEGPSDSLSFDNCSPVLCLGHPTAKGPLWRSL